MSSDSNTKSSYQKLKSLSRFFLLLLLMLVILAFQTYNPFNRLTENQRRQKQKQELERIKRDLPPKCHPTLHSFLLNQQQQQPKVHSKLKKTIVFACHRKWCGKSYGHCEPMSGLGDRTRHVLSLITDAMNKHLAIQLDYPQESNGLTLRLKDYYKYSSSNQQTVEYHDPWGSLSELFRFRSYDVSDKRIHLEEWGQQQYEFVNFIPTKPKYHLHSYDPCLFHILFQPIPELKEEILHHASKFQSKNVIGIHYRTGDLAAFGVQNRDVRTANGLTLKEGYDRMLACAEKLASRLQVQPFSTRNSDSKKLHFFLATDNEEVKAMAEREERHVLYLTPDKPSAYLRSEGDRSAYLELYLLSRTRGLVVNQLPKEFENGPAEKISTFAMLAKNIGFMDDESLMPCNLDVV